MRLRVSPMASLLLLPSLSLHIYAMPQTAAVEPSLYALESQAQKAYDAKQYAAAVSLFEKAFSRGLRRNDDFYNAACSSALAGDSKRAIDYLQRADDLGFRDPEVMKADPDLETVRLNPRFQLLLNQAQKNERNYNRSHHDPKRAKIITSDIDLFWEVYDKRSTSSNPEELIQDEYFGRGSPGLQDFIFSRIHSASDLLNTINKAPKYYAALRTPSSRIKDFTPQIRKSFRRMKEIYPNSIFPDVYFLVGRMNSGGTTGPSGLLLGADMYGNGPNVPMGELDEWHRDVVSPVDNIPAVVAHELVHYEQKVPGKTLLAQTISEGSADFIGELISGSATNGTARQYGLQHEAELWKDFSREMSGTDASHWMYQGKTENGRPPDLAYFIGYRITEAYYQKAPDKKKAIAEILNCSDVDKFLRDSGYAERFNIH